MNVTDALLQMVYSTAWQLPSISNTGKDMVTDGSGSFQAMLEERQSQLTKPADGENGGDTTEEPVEGLPVQPADDGQEPDQNMDLLALSAAMMGQGIPQIQTPVVETQAADVTALTVDLTQVAPAAQQAGLPQAVAEVPLTVEQQPQETVQQAEQQPQETVLTDLPNTQTVTTPKESQRADVSEDTQANPFLSQQKDSVEVLESSGPVETPVFQETEYVPVKVGESVTVDTTAPAQEMDAALSKAMSSALKDGSQRLEIQLSPANLGTVVAEFTRSPEGALHVVLRTENEHAAKLLSEHANALGLLLQDGTNSEVRVEVPQSQQQQHLWQQPDQNGGQQQQQQQQQRHVPKEETETFLHQLRLGLLSE